MTLQTAGLLGQTFRRFLYATLHSLFLGKEPDGTRVPRPLPQAPAWFGCFDYVQLNEEELAQLGDDPLALAAGGGVWGRTPGGGGLGGRGGGAPPGGPPPPPPRPRRRGGGGSGALAPRTAAPAPAPR